MNHRRKLLLLAGLPALAPLGGCITIDLAEPGETLLQYRWHDDGPMPEPREQPLVEALLLQPVPGAAMADTTGIAYTRGDHAFAYYQYASWTERPLRVLPRLLQRRLEARGTAGASTLLGDQQRADWLLTLAIDELHHDVSTPPGSARLALTAELFQRRERRRVAWQRFEQNVPLVRADAAAAVDGLSTALTRTLDALLPWLEDALVHAAPRSTAR
jgi:ABC-type uncharacterized transport system auxiliary subunit